MVTALTSAAFIFAAGRASQARPVVAPFQPITIPEAIATRAGASLKFRAHARGTQVYTCTASAANPNAGADGATKYAWVLKAPDAKLYDDDNTPIGTHFAGPTWLSNDGSSAVGAKVGQVNAPLADAIPWLQVKIVKHTGNGIFSDVTTVLRLNTTKGLAPTTGCDASSVGTTQPVDYTADYYFYKGGPITSDGA